MNSDVIMWITVAAVFAIVEAVTASLVSIWFVIGAVVTAFVAAAGAAMWVQIPVFLLVSAVVLVLTKPLIKKMKKPAVPTNADRLIGTKAVVIEEINPELNLGRVKASGMEWSAKSRGGEVIPEGTVISIVGIEGVKLIISNS